MPGQVVALSRCVQVIPKCCGALPRPQCGANSREDGRSSLGHVSHVEQNGRNPIACAQALECIYFVFLEGEETIWIRK